MATAQEEWCKKVLLTKELTLASGLICYWPDCKRTRSGYIQESSKIYNLPVQSLATAEIIPVAVTYLWHKMREHNMQSFLVNTVHDSAIAEVHPDEVELFEKLAIEAFSTDVYNYLKRIYGIEFNVPLGIGMKIGDNWGVANLDISNNVYRNSAFSNCVSIDNSGELKYVPVCPYEFKAAA